MKFFLNRDDRILTKAQHSGLRFVLTLDDLAKLLDTKNAFFIRSLDRDSARHYCYIII